MMMARLSLLHSLPRLASMAPFLCLIVAQWEWPDMASPRCLTSMCLRPDPRVSGLYLSDLLLDLFVAVGVRPAGVGVEQRQRLLPRRHRPVHFLQAIKNVAQVVPDDRVVVAPGHLAGPLQLLAG